MSRLPTIKTRAKPPRTSRNVVPLAYARRSRPLVICSTLFEFSSRGFSFHLALVRQLDLVRSMLNSQALELSQLLSNSLPGALPQSSGHPQVDLLGKAAYGRDSHEPPVELRQNESHPGYQLAAPTIAAFHKHSPRSHAPRSSSE